MTFISAVAYNAATRVGLVKAYPAIEDDIEAGLYNGGYAALPGGARAEAERRRQANPTLTSPSLMLTLSLSIAERWRSRPLINVYLRAAPAPKSQHLQHRPRLKRALRERAGVGVQVGLPLGSFLLSL